MERRGLVVREECAEDWRRHEGAVRRCVFGALSHGQAGVLVEISCAVLAGLRCPWPRRMADAILRVRQPGEGL
ncbi:hypothetical protein RxyAA322_25090 [Rubrobacter xylanophilus]|uniref:Uncharacterized protein n=1 Tax=Rubrobacter xylanophilus TaxID=49319 RepID=A0A510HMU3_9ACTN|nr:hypothetical protein [Rubrobacter xylanophilus]BBL80655.1 hypothetical protein RxyAA322_25090 [Rubrobacter xylanophilus]